MNPNLGLLIIIFLNKNVKTFYLLGLFATSISHAIGTRPTVIFGGILATAGILASSFCQSTSHLVVTIGVVSGER